MRLNRLWLQKHFIQTFLLVFLSFFLGIVPAQAQKAIDFTLKDTDGNATRLSDYLKKDIILISFWATWCLPCIKEMPHLQEIYEKYRTKGLRVLMISIDGPESAALVKPFISRYKYTFPVLLDTETKVVALYNPRIIVPYTILIDKAGEIAYVHQGYSPGDEEDLEEKIGELLKPKEVGEPRELSYHLNEAFLNRNFSDEDYVNRVRNGRKSQIINQVDLSLTKGQYILGIRFDSNLDFSPLDEKFSLAKRFFEVNTNNINLRIGDFYYSMGRGLVLSVLKTFEEEGLEYIIDTTMDGGKFFLSYGLFTGEIFGGWIEREDSEEKDLVLGGSLGWNIGEYALLQPHFLYSHLEEGSEFGNKTVFIESIGLSIPKISDYAKLYGELSIIQKETYFKEKRINGHGFYLESSFFLNDVTLLFEFKDYKNLNFEYNRPPLLESEQLEILANQFVTDATDITGVSIRMDYFSQKLMTLFYGKGLFIHENPDDHALFGRYERDVFHFFGGLETKFKNTGYLNFLTGYRKEKNTSLAFLNTHGDTYHYQFNFNYPLTSRLSLEADWKNKFFRGKHIDFTEIRSFVSLHCSPRWILTLFFDHTDEPEVLLFKDRRNWWGGQIEVKISHANSIRMFYGSTKGAVKCSGGICRYFPPFEGLRIEAILRF